VREISAGETVAFLYNPKNSTETVMINYWWWLGVAVVGFFAMTFTLLSLIVIRTARTSAGTSPRPRR
jgi:hypothetical protein